MAEYEALIAGMKLGKTLSANNLIAHTDSQLVAHQINGLYNVKDKLLAKYHSVIATLSCKFTHVTIK